MTRRAMEALTRSCVRGKPMAAGVAGLSQTAGAAGIGADPYAAPPSKIG